MIIVHYSPLPLSATFFPRVNLYNFFLYLAIYGGLGLGSLTGIGIGFFLLMGFGVCGVGPSGFFGLGLSI